MNDEFMIFLKDGTFLTVTGEEMMLVAVYNHTKDIASLKRISRSTSTD